MWKKKLREYKGKYSKYSLRNKLLREKKINSDFEVILNTLTLEEIIALKLELSNLYINNKLYNFPLYKSIKYIIKESLLIFALSSTRTTKDAANVLGVRERDFLEEIKKFKLKPSDCTYDETN
jgi:predicted nucleic acid-binding protein